MPDKITRLKVKCPGCGQKLDLSGWDAFARVPCPVCRLELVVPKRFGEILLEEPVGNGGMARVYRALDLALDREIAVKILDPDMARNPDWVRLFLHEARSAATLNHPNVIPVYSCGEHDGQPYILMQFMGGGALNQQIKECGRTIAIDFVLRAGADAARGLAAAWEQGIVHHDVKPGNMLLDRSGGIKVGDFGLAEIVRDATNTSLELLTRGWISPYYVSTEKVQTGREDYRGDIYSLGASLYHLLTGIPPFSGDTPETVAAARINGAVPPNPCQHRPEIPPDLAAFVMALLAPEPEARPQNYDQIVEQLEAFRCERRDRARREAAPAMPLPPLPRQALPVDDAALPPRLPGLAPASGVRADRTTPRPRLFNKLLCAGLLLLLGLGALIAWQRPNWYVRHLEPHLPWVLRRQHSVPAAVPGSAAAAPTAAAESDPDSEADALIGTRLWENQDGTWD